MTTVNEIAARLSSLCAQHKFVDAYTELFSDHAISIDPIYKNVPLEGLHNLIERERQFLAASQINNIVISEPLFAGNHFTVSMALDFTAADGERKSVEELCVYKVENGKIISQQFFIG